jgi:ketosteroid isomerase-like protein
VTSDDGNTPRAARIVGEAMRAYERGDLNGLAELVHPDADVEMVFLGGGAAHGRDELRGTLEQAQAGVHRPSITSIDALADDAAVMVGRVQHVDERGALSDRKAMWLAVLRDELIWRVRLVASPEEARAVYAQVVGAPPPGRGPGA